MLVEMLTGGALVAAGVLLGRALPNRRVPPPKPPEPICSCGHALSSHRPDSRTRPCNVVTLRLIGGAEVGRAECPCLQYIGPEPLPTVYAPEVLG